MYNIIKNIPKYRYFYQKPQFWRLSRCQKWQHVYKNFLVERFWVKNVPTRTKPSRSCSRSGMQKPPVLWVITSLHFSYFLLLSYLNWRLFRSYCVNCTTYWWYFILFLVFFYVHIIFLYFCIFLIFVYFFDFSWFLSIFVYFCLYIMVFTWFKMV